MTMTARTLTVIVLCAVAVLGLVGALAIGTQKAPAASKASDSANADLAFGLPVITPTPDITEPVADPQLVVAIGDSIMNGHGTEPGQSWPTLVAQRNNWRLVNLSTDGAGFQSEGDDGTTYQDQVDAAIALSPSLVIISASSNDLGEDDALLAASTLKSMTTLHESLPDTQIIAMSAFWGDTAPPVELDTVDSDLQSAAASVAARYIDLGQPLADRPWLMQDDDIHPTVMGLEVIADRVDEAIHHSPPRLAWVDQVPAQ